MKKHAPGALEELSQRLGHDFKQLALLKQALTHCSAHHQHNERLEFLGDALLNCIIASALYKLFPKAKEGKLTSLRASLVSGKALADLAREFELGRYLRLGPGEHRNGGTRRPSLLADAMEAVIAAIYLDSSLEVCHNRVLAWYKGRLSDCTLSRNLKDPKTRLQEHVQARRLPLPVYSVESVTGDAHNQRFRVECQVSSLAGVAGTGRSRREAEQDAARAALELLQNE